MKITYKTLKKVKKNYDEVFTKFKETKELHITIGVIELDIINQQVGLPLDIPQIIITTRKGSCSMDFDIFMKRITKN